MKVLIVGGGIGGLAAAIALSRTGHEVELVERAPVFSPVGAGIVMSPNAARLLGALGVDLSRGGRALRAMEIRGADGSLIQRVDTATEAFGPTWALPRPALHEALLAALPSSVRVRLGATVTGLVEGPDSVTVTLDDGAPPRTFPFVVGADGIRSRVRELVHGPVPLRYSGTTCYRGLLADFPIDDAVEAWGGAARIGLVPLRDGAVYYFLVLAAPRRAPALDGPDALRAAFQGFTGAPGRLLAALCAVPPLHHDLEELDAPVWGSARVVLIGDAAHAMTPNQGQGAAMAIEDAIAVSRALEPGVQGAHERLVGLRHARVRRVQVDSRRLGQVAHLRSAPMRWLRDGVLRTLPDSMARARYAAVVEPGLALLTPGATSAIGG